MPIVVRTWNLFHGNTQPPQRRGFLREMVELVTADRPDVVCLQEIPVWALRHLDSWSGMQCCAAIARRPLLRSAELGRRVTELNHGLFRSAFTGEAGAILLAPHFALDAVRVQVVAAEPLRRVAHGVRLDRRVYVVNFHLNGSREELERAHSLAGGEAQVVLAGDANLRPPYDLPGFSEPLAGGIDQILVRGLAATGPSAWPEERRRVAAGVLSDHAPVELTVE